MILSDLRAFIQEKQKVSLSDLVTHFQVEADALRGMLSKWIKKGKIRQVGAANANCGSTCCRCDPLLTEIYEWVEDAKQV